MPGVWEQTLTHSLPVALTTKQNKKMNESLVSIQTNSKVKMLPHMKTLVSLLLYLWGFPNMSCKLRLPPGFVLVNIKDNASLVYINLS